MANAKLGTKAVGSIVKLGVNGAAKEFIVVHQGKPGLMYDESCNGTWLLMKDIYENRVWSSSNINKYESSDVYPYLNGPFLNLFDSNIRAAIKQVKIPYRQNGGLGTDQSGANGLSCKVFLLSAPEVGWTTSDNPYFPVDGAKLSYFESGAGTSANNKRIAYLNGSVRYWELRSPYTDNGFAVWYVYSNGGYDYVRTSEAYGIRPALILPQDMEVDSSGNVTPPPPATHKTLVNGTAYTVKGGKCMVNGTVYSVKKGRTLIGGTGYDITFPAPLVMPAKGDLITMNLDGTDRLYRVLKIVDDTTVEVLGMWNVSTDVMFNSSDSFVYSGGTLDTYLNTIWYNTLTSNAKAAIVPKNINQYLYYFGSYNETTHSSYADYSTKSLKANVGNRYVYALDVEDIEMYFGGTGGSAIDKTPATFSKTDLLQLFWNRTTTISQYSVLWLCSAYAGDSRYAWCAFGDTGVINATTVSVERAARPAFQIDLSKIDFTIGGSVSKMWTFNSTVNSPASTPTILYANFTSNGTKFKAFNCDVMAGALNLSYLYLNQDASHTQLNVYYYNWQNEAYRTVIFDEAPSGDLLTWLQANATPQ
jgi:hypothetical protein